MGKRKQLEDLSVSELKKELWPIFSKFIRTRDCLKTCGGETVEVVRKNGDAEHLLVGRCYTCGKKYVISSLQAGHFIPKRRNSILYHEKGCHAQCYSCNISLHGNGVEYFIIMEKEYGREVVDELYHLDKVDKTFTKEELIGLIVTFSAKLRELETKKDELGIWD